MRRPPACVVIVARAHWIVGGAIAGGALPLFWVTRKLPIIFPLSSYLILGGLATLYLLGGTLVWFGAPIGRFLSRMCAPLYFIRPGLGFHLWKVMGSEEFKAHFQRREV